MRRTYKYRLYPTDAQKHALDCLLEQGRTSYNYGVGFLVYKLAGGIFNTLGPGYHRGGNVESMY